MINCFLKNYRNLKGHSTGKFSNEYMKYFRILKKQNCQDKGKFWMKEWKTNYLKRHNKEKQGKRIKWK